jgi:uncharacterized membrane protein
LLKAFAHRGWFHFLLLLVWIAIGASLRFANLAGKSPWSDEFATLVFSLGNSFRTVPLDRAIALNTLLMPLQPGSEAGIGDVFHNLMTESTHPPAYFMLNHLWLQLFPTQDGLVSLWAARSLSAILGVGSIPAIFGLGWLAFRSRLVGQMAAAMMAVSPYGIYQAQEARHYTLAILLIIASLSCLVIAARTIHRRTPLPIWVGLIWVVVNCLGIAVHYFFSLTLCVEALVLMVLAWRNRRHADKETREQGGQAGTGKTTTHYSLLTTHSFWWRLSAVAAGTLVGGLVWLPAWQSIPDNQMTQWIYGGNPFQNCLETIARFSAWIITMLWLLPLEGVSPAIALACSALVLIVVFWALTIFIRSWRILLGQALTRIEIQVLGGFVVVAIALFMGITYIVGADMSIAARYHFVYFPAFIVVIGSALAICWDAANLAARMDLEWTARQQSLLRFLKARGKKAVALIWLLGFLGALTVAFNFGYQKIERPDLLVPIIQKASQNPVLIAAAHKTHGQTREIMALGLEFKRRYRSLAPATGSATNSPLFLLAHQEPDSHSSTIALKNTLSQLPRPLDLWIVNFPRATSELETQNCVADSQRRPKTNGFKYKLYHCQ